MKELTRIKLINWHYFVNQTIDLRGSTLITGDNGSGKSTILDAVQLVLVADLRQVKFNVSAFDETKRNLLGYARCKTGSDAADGRVYLRGGDITSYAALEFFDSEKKQYFVLGAAIDSYKDNSTYAIKYFKIENSRLGDELFLQGQRPYNIKELKEALRARKAVLYPTAESYRRDLLVKLGSLGERFFSLFVKAISFKPITDIREFVYAYVLEERPINIEVMLENLQRYKEYSDLAAETGRKIAALEDIREKYGEIEREQRKVLAQEYLIRRGVRDQAAADLAANRRSVKEKGAELTRQVTRLRQARQQQKKLDDDYQAHRDTLAANSTFQLVERLKREINGLRDAQKEQAQRRDRVAAAAGAQVEVLTELLALAGDGLGAAAASGLGADGAPVLTEERVHLEAVAALLGAVAQGGWPEEAKATVADADDDRIGEASGLLAGGQELLHRLGERVGERLWTLGSEVKKLGEEENELRRHLESLKSKKFVYDRTVTALRDLIAVHFNRQGQEVTPAVLCELLEVPNEKWQDAVEGWLNTQRFDLIVAPEHFDAALAVYERGKRKHNISGVGLVNTGRVIRFLDRQEPGSLAEEVRSDNEYALAYVRLLLGNVMKCESEQELKHHRRAVTPTCMTYRNNAARQIHFRVYETPFIGERAFARQIARKEARLEELEREKARLEEAVRALEELRRLCTGRDEEYILVRQNLDVFGELAETGRRLAKVDGELRAVDTSGIAEIQRKLKELEQERGEAGQRIERLVDARGGLKIEIKRLGQERGGLETAGAEAEAAFQSFCGAYADLVEQGEKRYARERRDKAPGEIAANFRHNRKSLEGGISKQQNALIGLLSAYANKYQFGGRVSAEDIGDYQAEYKKLTQSELPEYEDKIKQAQQEAEVEFKEHFIFKLRENIENAYTEFNFLEAALKGIHFGTDQYKFHVRTSERHRMFHEMIMDTALVEGGQSLFDSLFRERHQEAMDELFDKVTNLPPSHLSDSIAEYTDYRTFLDYDIKIYHDNGETSTFSKVCREKSGGETQTPYYVAILASFVQLYRAKTNRGGIRLVMFDEAFNRMDSDRVENSLRFIRELGMQAIIAAPTDKCEYIAPHVPTTLLVLRDGHYSWIEDYQQLKLDAAVGAAVEAGAPAPDRPATEGAARSEGETAARRRAGGLEA